MPLRPNRARSAATTVGVWTITAAVLLAGCSTAAPVASPASPTFGVTVGVPAASTCVADPATVISRVQDPASITAPLPPGLVAKLQAAAAEGFKEAAAPGAVVAVRTPEGTWVSTFGTADPSTGEPMERGVHTRIGSVTKTFTGTVIMQLVELGKIKLDDPISKYVPGVPNGDRVTIRLLANMTSGVASYTRSSRFTDVYFAKPETVFTPDQLLKIGLEESPIFEPGAKFDYSNTNTILLGMVVEKVTGEKFEDVLKAQVLSRLMLTGTVWPGESTQIPSPYAQGFTLQGDFATPEEPSNATHWNPAWGWTAGQLISTIDDLLVYGRALGTGQGLLSPTSQATRLTSFPGPSGYGLALGCVDGWVGHTGELPGYNTSLFYDTTTDTTVAVQTNSDIPSGDCPDQPTLPANDKALTCSSPATRVFLALSVALGHPYVMP